MTTTRHAFAAALLSSALLAAAGTAPAQDRWQNHINASWVREIVEHNGLLYMATAGGILEYDPATGRFVQFTNASGLPSNDVTCLVFDDDGALYAGSAEIGIAKMVLDGDRLNLVRSFNQQIDGLADNAVNAVARWNGDIFYGTDGGAGTIVNDFPAALYRTIEGMPSNVVRDVLPVGDNVWMATDSGAVVLDDIGLLTTPAGGPDDPNVVGYDGTLVYLGTGDGVWTYDPSLGTWASVGLVGRPIYSLHYDGQTMRAGSRRDYWDYQGGTSWLMHSVNSVYLEYRMSGAASRIKGLFAAPNGDVYVGSGQESDRRGFNLVRDRGGDLVNLAPDAPGGANVVRLSVEDGGSLWASFFNFYVGKLNPNDHWVNYNPTIPESDSLSSQYANLTCLADADGYKWFCTLSYPDNARLLDRLDDKGDDDYSNDEWAHYGIGDGGGDGLGTLRPQRAVLDPAGNRWLLADVNEFAPGWDGINILSRDQSEWLQVKPGMAGVSIAGGNVTDVAFDPTTAYIALRDVGVQSWRHNGYDWATLKNFTSDAWTIQWAASADEQASAVEVDHQGRLWIGTNNGLYRVGGGSIKHYGLFSGFSAGLLDKQVNDLALDREGNVWVATGAGLNRVSATDEDEIDAWSTAVQYQRTLSQLQYPFDVISPLVDPRCQVLAVHPTLPIIYIGTANGISIFRYPAPPPPKVPLSEAYVYPNPAFGDQAHDRLFVEDVTEPVVVEIYTVEGELVYSTPSGEVLESGDEIWDLTDQGGYVVASGVYFVRIIGATTGDAVIKPVSIVR